MNFKTLLILLGLLTPLFYLSQDTLSTTVKLVNGKDTVYLSDLGFVEIHSSNEIDSTYEQLEASEFALLKDTIIVAPINLYEITSYKNNKRHYKSETYWTSHERFKLPIANIDYFRNENAIKAPMQYLEVLSVVSALIAAPIVALSTKDFRKEAYLATVGASAGLFIVSLSIDEIWGYKTYHTKKYKHKKVWTIE